MSDVVETPSQIGGGVNGGGGSIWSIATRALFTYY